MDPGVAERPREALPPLDLGGRAVAPRGDVSADPLAPDPPDGRRAAQHWLNTTWGRWSLRVAAAAAFLALGVWYGIGVAHRVATDLTPGPGGLHTLVDPAIGGPPSGARARGVKLATDAYVAELMRLEAEKDRMTTEQRAAAETAARDRLAKELEQLALKPPE